MEQKNNNSFRKKQKYKKLKSLLAPQSPFKAHQKASTPMNMNITLNSEPFVQNLTSSPESPSGNKHQSSYVSRHSPLIAAAEPKSEEEKFCEQFCRFLSQSKQAKQEQIDKVDKRMISEFLHVFEISNKNRYIEYTAEFIEEIRNIILRLECIEKKQKTQQEKEYKDQGSCFSSPQNEEQLSSPMHQLNLLNPKIRESIESSSSSEYELDGIRQIAFRQRNQFQVEPLQQQSIRLVDEDDKQEYMYLVVEGKVEKMVDSNKNKTKRMGKNRCQKKSNFNHAESGGKPMNLNKKNNAFEKSSSSFQPYHVQIKELEKSLIMDRVSRMSMISGSLLGDTLPEKASGVSKPLKSLTRRRNGIKEKGLSLNKGNNDSIEDFGNNCRGINLLKPENSSRNMHSRSPSLSPPDCQPTQQQTCNLGQKKNTNLKGNSRSLMMSQQTNLLGIQRNTSSDINNSQNEQLRSEQKSSPSPIPHSAEPSPDFNSEKQLQEKDRYPIELIQPIKRTQSEEEDQHSEQMNYIAVTPFLKYIKILKWTYDQLVQYVYKYQNEKLIKFIAKGLGLKEKDVKHLKIHNKTFYISEKQRESRYDRQFVKIKEDSIYLLRDGSVQMTYPMKSPKEGGEQKELNAENFHCSNGGCQSSSSENPQNKETSSKSPNFVDYKSQGLNQNKRKITLNEGAIIMLPSCIENIKNPSLQESGQIQLEQNATSTSKPRQTFQIQALESTVLIEINLRVVELIKSEIKAWGTKFVRNYSQKLCLRSNYMKDQIVQVDTERNQFSFENIEIETKNNHKKRIAEKKRFRSHEQQLKSDLSTKIDGKTAQEDSVKELSFEGVSVPQKIQSSDEKNLAPVKFVKTIPDHLSSEDKQNFNSEEYKEFISITPFEIMVKSKEKVQNRINKRYGINQYKQSNKLGGDKLFESVKSDCPKERKSHFVKKEKINKSEIKALQAKISPIKKETQVPQQKQSELIVVYSCQGTKQKENTGVQQEADKNLQGPNQQSKQVHRQKIDKSDPIQLFIRPQSSTISLSKNPKRRPNTAKSTIISSPFIKNTQLTETTAITKPTTINRDEGCCKSLFFNQWIETEPEYPYQSIYCDKQKREDFNSYNKAGTLRMGSASKEKGNKKRKLYSASTNPSFKQKQLRQFLPSSHAQLSSHSLLEARKSAYCYSSMHVLQGNQHKNSQTQILKLMGNGKVVKKSIKYKTKSKVSMNIETEDQYPNEEKKAITHATKVSLVLNHS